MGRVVVVKSPNKLFQDERKCCLQFSAVLVIVSVYFVCSSVSSLDNLKLHRS